MALPQGSIVGDERDDEGVTGSEEGRGTRRATEPNQRSIIVICAADGTTKGSKPSSESCLQAKEETTDVAEWPLDSLGRARSWAVAGYHWPSAPGDCLDGRVRGTSQGAQMTVVSEKLSSQPICASANDKKALRRTDEAVVVKAQTV